MTEAARLPTPQYNTSVIVDMVVEQHQHVLQTALEAVPRLNEAIVLLKVPCATLMTPGRHVKAVWSLLHLLCLLHNMPVLLQTTWMTLCCIVVQGNQHAGVTLCYDVCFRFCKQATCSLWLQSQNLSHTGVSDCTLVCLDWESERYTTLLAWACSTGLHSCTDKCYCCRCGCAGMACLASLMGSTAS